MRRVFGAGLSAGLCLACVSGCGEKGPPPRPAAVAEGAVAYDGEPVPSGIITFVPIDGGTGTGAPVINGRYRVEPDAGLTTGKFRVEIRWAKPTGEKIKDAGYGMPSEVVAEGLPEKYNAQSVLTADLQAGPNAIDFRLEK